MSDQLGEEVSEPVNEDVPIQQPSPPSPAPSISNAMDPAVFGVNPSNYNLRNPAVKRILREAAELSAPSEEVYARPLEDNLFEWHFTIRGAPDSDFATGVYHGRIILPAEYPMKPPSIILLTPNGRFETGTKICLSISSYHPETWRPCWSIRTALVALISFMTTESPGAIGSLEMPSDIRRQLAKQSLIWKCDRCGPSINHIRYICAEPSTGAPKAQQLFRIPHDPSEVFDRNVPQEDMMRNQQNGPVTMSIDVRAGDGGGRVIADAEADEDDDDVLDLGNGVIGHSVMTIAIGSVALAIFAIVMNRVMSTAWWESYFG